MGLRKLLVSADLIVSVLQRGVPSAEPLTQLPEDVEILDARFHRWGKRLELLLRSDSWSGSNGLAGGLDQASPILLEFRRRETNHEG